MTLKGKMNRVRVQVELLCVGRDADGLCPRGRDDKGRRVRGWVSLGVIGATNKARKARAASCVEDFNEADLDACIGGWHRTERGWQCGECMENK